MTIMAQSFNELTCTVMTEYLRESGEVEKKCVYRDVLLVLGRNEFSDILVRLDTGKQIILLTLKDAVVYQRFAKEGKATIKIAKPSMNLMISNCPPDRLIVFIKTLMIKLGHTKQKKTMFTGLQRLTSDKPRQFTDISPLTIKDVNTAHEQRVILEKNNCLTPRAGKRKRETEQEKENAVPGVVESQCRKTLRMKLNYEMKNQGLCQRSPSLSAVVLSPEQRNVLNAVLSGCNLFYTGSAGTGKSFLLKRILGALPPQYTYVTASTGVAACHVGGTTLHAFAGIGSGEADLSRCIELASRPVFLQQWKDCKHLVIDEVSMIDGLMFDKLEAVARAVRQNNKPFGGIQLILSGDFLQLPPVTKAGAKRVFAFQSVSWRKCINKYLELKEVHRQVDKKFVNILQGIRLGRCTDEAVDCLKLTASRRIDQDGITATRLCTHKDDVDDINKFQLERLDTKTYLFRATDSDSCQVLAADELCAVGSVLELKQGAQVMLTKNLDISKGLVNGARGVVVGFDAGTKGFPVVKFIGGMEMVIYPEKWVIRLRGGSSLERRQLPLKLAWALSIHKSQGMTLDCVEISLSRVFECGQAYVALSRAKNLDGLRIIDFDRRCVRADAQVLEFYRQIAQDIV